MRHHGVVTGTCIHGYAPGTCLICQTLGPAQDVHTPPAPTRTAERRGKGRSGKLAVPEVTSGSRAVAKADTGPRVVPKEAPPTASPAIFKLIGLVVAVVVLIVVAWTALHLVFAVLHILELIGVAAIFGYLGYVVGDHHGHRKARRP